MRIAVLAKVVSDYEIPPSIFELDGNRIKDQYNRLIGLYDEHAAEVAIQLAEKTGSEVEVISYGIKSDSAVLRKLLARGATSLTMILGEDDDPLLVASECSKIIKEKQFDIVLAGRQSSDLERGVVPGLIAAMLNIPYVTNVKQIELDKGYMILIKQIKGGIMNIKAIPPVIVSVTDDPSNIPRVPTVRGVLQAKKKPVNYIESTISAKSSVEEISVGIQRVEYECEILPSDNLEQTADLLIEKLKKERVL